MFFKIGALKKFANFTGKYLCWSLFLKKLDPQVCNFIKRRLQHRCFPVKFAVFQDKQQQQSVQIFFSYIPYRQQISDHLQLSQSQTNLKIQSLTKNLFP